MNYRIACEIICFASFFSVVSVSRLFETFDWLKLTIFVEINGPLSSVNFYNKLIHFFIQQHKHHSCNKRES